MCPSQKSADVCVPRANMITQPLENDTSYTSSPDVSQQSTVPPQNISADQIPPQNVLTAPPAVPPGSKGTRQRMLSCLAPYNAPGVKENSQDHYGIGGSDSNISFGDLSPQQTSMLRRSMRNKAPRQFYDAASDHYK